MTLQKWAEYGWLRSHKTSKDDILLGSIGTGNST